MLVSLSPSGALVAVVSGSRLTLFPCGETNSKGTARQYVQRGQVALEYTSVAWHGEEKIVVGSKLGGGVIWDVRRGVSVSSLAAAEEHKEMRCVAWSLDGLSVFGACGSRAVCKWEASTGALTRMDWDKKGVSCVAPNPLDGDVVACGSTQLRLIKLNKDKVTKLNLQQGHASSCTSLSWAANGRFLASAATGSRVVLVHDCGALKNDNTKVISVTLESWPVSLSLLSEAAYLEVAAARDDGLLQLVRHSLSDASVSTTSSRASSKVLAVRHSKQNVLVANAPESRPRGGRVDPIKTLKKPIDIRLFDDEEPVVEKEEKKTKKRQAEVLGVEALAPRAAGLFTGNEAPEKKQAKTEEEATLGEKLEALARRSTLIEETETASSSPVATVRDARSLAHIVTQALDSNDEAMLEEALGRSDPASIDATLRRLGARQALPLLRALATRLEKRPKRAPELARWAAACVELHATSLASSPNLGVELSRLRHVVDQRVATLPKFLALHARLELVLKHSSHGAADSSELLDTPNMTFDLAKLDDEEEEEEDEEDEVEEDDEEEDEEMAEAGAEEEDDDDEEDDDEDDDEEED